MGFLKDLFSGSKREAVPTPTPAHTQGHQIYQRLMDYTKKPVLALDLSEGSAGLFDSKLGGAFYVPVPDDCPMNADGEPLYLLAQLNFGQLPKLPDFPEKGLLQIFIDGLDTTYGVDFDNPVLQDNWCIRYVADLPSEQNVPAACIFEPAWSDETVMPLPQDMIYRLTATESWQAITAADWQSTQALKKYCGDLLPDNFENVFDLDDDVFDVWQELGGQLVCQVGGYPDFTQYDPREDIEDAPDVLLFQLGSTDEILWGDAGIANFFIRREDLRSLDFSNVWYNWDCF